MQHCLADLDTFEFKKTKFHAQTQVGMFCAVEVKHKDRWKIADELSWNAIRDLLMRRDSGPRDAGGGDAGDCRAAAGLGGYLVAPLISDRGAMRFVLVSPIGFAIDCHMGYVASSR
jgi:hypothetical protein